MDGDANHIKAILSQGEEGNAIFRKPSKMHPKLKDDAVVLSEIEDALDRIDGGSFGYCAGCGEQIDILRLAHDPTITHCLSCKMGNRRERK